MLFLLLILHFLWLVSPTSFSASEFDALWDFYNSTNGNNWIPLQSAWDFSDPEANPCNWSGVGCIVVNNVSHVLYLTLDNANLSGTLPLSFVNFTKLSSLQLLDNNLRGPLPTGMDQMASLQIIGLNYNFLSGPLPQTWAKSSVLSSFNIDHNRMNGSLPEWLFDLPNMHDINICHNNFTGTLPFSTTGNSKLATLLAYVNSLNGSLSKNIGNYPRLMTLMLDINDLTGTIPSELESLNTLGTLTLDRNHFHGVIPSTLCNVTSIYEIDLSYNHFQGSLPDCLGNLTGLLYFKASHNEITGSLPHNFTSLQNLYVLDVAYNHMTGHIVDAYPENCPLSSFYGAYNHFSGTLPRSLRNCFKLTEMKLADNRFEGSLPDFSEFPLYYVTILDFSYNQLSGSLPVSLTSLIYLQELLLSGNNLEGSLLSELSTFNQLAIVQLSDNLLSGSMPSTLGYMYPVLFLSLDHNLLSGAIPTTLAGLHNLQLLFVSNNALSGSIEEIFDCTKQINLMYVDVSKNQLSAHLPANLFSCPSLRTFTALSNCFSGPLPVEMCGATNLTSLVLDGLMSATSCQKRFFKNFEAVVSYGLSSRIPDGIPECLFTLPKLETLHLSGNGLTGSLPHDLRVGESLHIMSLSHNSLRGSIPHAIRDHIWYELDLSYNKITGTLASTRFNDDEFFYYYTNLALQVNRLSGVIPAPLRDLPKISMLDGNLFQCDASRKDLPTNDPDAKIYSCGSTSFNNSIYFWCAVITTSAILGISLWIWKVWELSDANFDKSSVVILWKKIVLWKSMYSLRNGDTSYVPNVKLFGGFMQGVRRIFLWLTLFIVCVLLPTYVALSEYYDTYTHEYAWFLSGVYLSGVAPSVVLFLLLIAFCLGAVLAVYILCPSGSRIDEKQQEVKKAGGYQSVVLAAVIVWNMILVTGVNIAYVYIDHNYSATVVAITQVFVAIFKVTWNNVIVRYVLEKRNTVQAENVVERLSDAENEMSTSVRNTDDAVVYPTSWSSSHNSTACSSGIGLAAFVMLFNNIAAPFIATGYVSSNCFYDIVTSPKEVSVTYTFVQCSQFLTSGNVTMCYGYDDAFASTVSYPPPYLYSYQCASTYITTYANIFILMMTIDSFFIPCALWVMKAVYAHLIPESVLFRMVSALLPPLLQPLNADRNKTVFDCDAFVVKLVNIFGILCTFGAILPPVAVICCVAVFLITHHMQLLLGRFVYLTTFNSESSSESSSTTNNKLQSQLNKDCDKAVVMFMSGAPVLVPFVVIFFGAVLFDTLGDVVGWQKALSLPLLMILLPTLAYCTFKYHRTLKETCCTRTKRRISRSISKESGLSYSYIQHTPEYAPLHDNEATQYNVGSSELVSESINVGLL